MGSQPVCPSGQLPASDQSVQALDMHSVFTAGKVPSADLLETYMPSSVVSFYFTCLMQKQGLGKTGKEIQQYLKQFETT